MAARFGMARLSIFPAEMSVTTTLILIADDHVLVRDGLRAMLSAGLAAVRWLEADNGSALVRMVGAHPRLDLALVDLNMPGMESGLRLCELARLHPRLPLIVISALTSPDVIRRTLEIPSVHVFVPKSAPSEYLRHAVAAALQGRRLPYDHHASTADPSELPLTPRMEEVHRLLRRGMSNKQIALTLGISEGTVKNHISGIFRILQVSNRTQAAQHDGNLV
ncbi:MAG: response regulator transcription factor [Rhodoferax sp.]|nr:response regulator transcription factor [Rhodoferax sp.]HQX58241.1 response regulator transcription factor [Burkholderiaceae bacterium]HQZ05524.1 response regulator transcription factor [Burkholderiaceae bacterium]HRA63145.1 response regulator transcription factor [Burkholderiaceae bacterium]